MVATATTTKLDRVLARSLIKTLQVMGHGGMTSTLRYLRDVKGVSLHDIPHNLAQVDEGLDALFGASSIFIRNKTVRCVCSALKLETPLLGRSLEQMVAEIRASSWKQYIREDASTIDVDVRIPLIIPVTA